MAAEHVLATEYSFDLAEPCYRKCVALLEHDTDLRRAAVELMAELYDQGILSDEPIAYLVHVLQWTEVAEWARARLMALDNPRCHGRPLEKIMEALSADWENRDFYKFSD